MSTQEQSKIEELSDKVRGLVDKVSILERENRSLREKYRDALERLDEAEKDVTTLLERYAPLVGAAGSMSNEQVADMAALLTGKLEEDRHG